MKEYLPLLLLLFILMGCASPRLVEEWKNPELPSYAPKKILVIGMTSDATIRRSYEATMVQTLEREGIIAVRSVDFFESRFHSNLMKQSDLDAVEKELMEKNFDVVLITQLMGKEEKVAYINTHREPLLLHSNFKELYLHHQDVFKTEERTTYTVYHTHSSFYCLCPGTERELIWSGGIDLIGPEKKRSALASFCKKLVKTIKNGHFLELN